MNGVTAVLNKELTNYFQSPIAYFIVAVFLLGTGYFFIDHVFLRGSALGKAKGDFLFSNFS